jgi:UDP-N-acetylglucosamine 2-epimerase (non-hydrolysing)
MKILLCVGARPNYPKLKPIADLLSNAVIVDSGQHYDFNLSKSFYKELKIRKPDYFLGCDKRKDTFFSDIIEKFVKIIDKEKPDKIVVFGDIDSTLAFALAAKRKKVKLYHVESGLRSNDMEMPEELCRITVDSMSDVRFCTEESGIKNLKKSGLSGILVGNTMIDTMFSLKGKFKKTPKPYKKYAVLTLHRPANVDNGETLFGILNKINKVIDYPVIYSKHPRVGFLKIGSSYGSVKIVKPINYIEFHGLMAKSNLVITDSGGIQEETSALGVPCVTIRTTTERPVTIERGSNVLCKDTNNIEQCIGSALKKRGKGTDIWDGKSAQRIVEYLRE